MNTDSNKTVKTYTPLSLKYKLETTTPRVRAAFTPITNTYRPPSIKNIFIRPEEHLIRCPIKGVNKTSLPLNLLFPIRNKTLPMNSPTRELNDITASNIDSYEMGKILGQGAYAVVRVCTHLNEKIKYAIKSYDKYKLKEPHRRKNIRREIEIMKMLDHPNIVKMREAVKSHKHVHIVQEYFPGFSLGNYLKSRVSKKLPENEARKVFRQVLGAIDYLHGLNISHRDIKLDNILIDTKLNIKVIDFGFSSLDDTKSKTFCGTPSYMAPEIVTRREYLPQKADIWALGVILYIILSGSFPFRAGNDKELYAKITEGIKELPESIPSAPKRLISKMLSQNPYKRPHTKELLNELWVLDNQEHSYKQIVKLCRSPSTER